MNSQIRIIRKKDQHEQEVQAKLLRNPSATAHALRLQWLAERKAKLQDQWDAARAFRAETRAMA